MVIAIKQTFCIKFNLYLVYNIPVDALFVVKNPLLNKIYLNENFEYVPNLRCLRMYNLNNLMDSFSNLFLNINFCINFSLQKLRKY